MVSFIDLPQGGPIRVGFKEYFDRVELLTKEFVSTVGSQTQNDIPSGSREA